MDQLRQAGPCLDACLRNKALQQRADRFGAEKHRLDQPAGVQQPVGEHVTAIRVSAELDLVHRQELGVAVQRHGFHRARKPPGVGWDDLLLPGDQRHVTHTFLGHHPVVVLAGEQAEGKPDDPGRMPQHAFDGEMGLAGVRRTEDCFDARCDCGTENGHGEMVGCCGAECKRSFALNPARGLCPLDPKQRQRLCNPSVSPW